MASGHNRIAGTVAHRAATLAALAVQDVRDGDRSVNCGRKYRISPNGTGQRSETAVVRFPRCQALCPLAGGEACYERLSGRTDSFQLLVRIAFKMEQLCGWFCCTISK